MKVLQINVFNYRKGGSEAVYFSTSELLKEHGESVINFALKWREKYTLVSSVTDTGISQPHRIYQHEGKPW